MISLDIAALRTAYADGTLTPTALVDDVLARIAAHDDPATWICRVDEEDLRARAAALETQDSGDLPLYGSPFAVKDNIDIAGMPTTAACPAYAYTAQKTAPVVQTLLDAGAILIGKTNLDQFATGLVGVRSPYGTPRNAINPELVPGGSSAGSAVAVAAGLVSFALGTDTAGSGRIPAGLNNIVGVKPTRGLLSARGVVPACRTLDCVSIFALNADDGRAVLDVVGVYDPDDAYARRKMPFTPPALEGFAGVRVGIPSEDGLEFFGDESFRDAFSDACDRLTSLGAEIVAFDYGPFAEAAAMLYSGSWVAERFLVIRDLLDKNPDAVHPVTRAIIDAGRDKSAADTFEAAYRMAEIARLAERVWQDIDVMLLPTAGTSYTVAEVEADPIALNSNLGRYTNFVNLLDMAAIAVPSGWARADVPFGITLIGPAFSDHWLAMLGAAYHASVGGAIRSTDVPVPPPGARSDLHGEADLLLAVNGAHMRGLPLNDQLLDADARFVREDRTGARYRLVVLDGFSPERPGLLRDEQDGGPIDVEIWSMPISAVGAFLKRIPAPLGLGTVELASGERVTGFLCEYAAAVGARDITALGGWRRYLSEGDRGAA